MKIARAATNPKKPHGYQHLCKQWHLGKAGNSEGQRKKKSRHFKKNSQSYQDKERKHYRKKPYKHTKMFSKEKEIICFNCNKKGHTTPNCPEKKKEKSKKKMSYRNKKGKVNFFDFPSSCDEFLSSDSEKENKLNHVYYDTSSDEELCRDPHCTKCRDCDCSDPDICNCNAVRMMRTDDDEISRNLLTQMMAATDPQIKEMYKSLLTDHLTKIPSSSKKSPNKGYVPHASLFSVEALTR